MQMARLIVLAACLHWLGLPVCLRACARFLPVSPAARKRSVGRGGPGGQRRARGQTPGRTVWLTAMGKTVANRCSCRGVC